MSEGLKPAGDIVRWPRAAPWSPCRLLSSSPSGAPHLFHPWAIITTPPPLPCYYCLITSRTQQPLGNDALIFIEGVLLTVSKVLVSFVSNFYAVSSQLLRARKTEGHPEISAPCEICSCEIPVKLVVMVWDNIDLKTVHTWCLVSAQGQKAEPWLGCLTVGRFPNWHGFHLNFKWRANNRDMWR